MKANRLGRLLTVVAILGISLADPANTWGVPTGKAGASTPTQEISISLGVLRVGPPELNALDVAGTRGVSGPVPPVLTISATRQTSDLNTNSGDGTKLARIEPLYTIRTDKYNAIARSCDAASGISDTEVDDSSL